MKQGLKAVDFTLFRIIPLVFLLFVLYADVRTSFEAFNRINNYSFYSFLESFSAILCFVILGFLSVLKSFKKTKKFSLYCRYGAGVMALIYIVLSLLERIQSLWLLRSLEYTPETSVFSDCFSLLSLQKTLYIIAFLTVIMNSVLNDKFFKVKQILTIVCTVSFFGANFCNPLYTLIRYNGTVSFRFLFNSSLYSYSFCAVILTGLFPTKAAIEVPQS